MICTFPSRLPLIFWPHLPPLLSLTLFCIYQPFGYFSNNTSCLRAFAPAVPSTSNVLPEVCVWSDTIHFLMELERLSLNARYKRHSPAPPLLCLIFLFNGYRQLPEPVTVYCVSPSSTSFPQIISFMKAFWPCFVHCCFSRAYNSVWQSRHSVKICWIKEKQRMHFPLLYCCKGKKLYSLKVTHGNSYLSCSC